MRNLSGMRFRIDFEKSIFEFVLKQLNFYPMGQRFSNRELHKFFKLRESIIGGIRIISGLVLACPD